jgi:ketosteroid isomerase-like protein
MSQEQHIERGHAILADFRAGKTEFDADGRITRMVGEEYLDPEIEWDATQAPVPDLCGFYRGKDAVRGWWERWFAAWETVDFEYEIVDAGDDRLVALFDLGMRGYSTDLEMSFNNAQVTTWRNGLMVHWKLYLSHAEALEAAVLRE